MASMLGWKPSSVVFGTSAGKLDCLSTATTCLPAPIANSDSVCVGESETMRVGCLVMASGLPPGGVTSTGKAGPAGAGAGAWPRSAQPVSASALASVAATRRWILSTVGNRTKLQLPSAN